MRALRPLLLIGIAALLVPYVVAPLERTGHPVSVLMLWRRLEGEPVVRHWVAIGAMSPALPRAVVAAEDEHFCTHHGIDWGAVHEVIDDAEEGGAIRGASTITQQVAKNLFLWPVPDLIRKVLEFPLAMWVDLVLPKQRILEIYLNVAEMGPSGQFGAEAGARYAFGRSAAKLSPRQAALLAAVLPNPLTRSARNPRSTLRRLARIYMARAKRVRRCWVEKH
ncbi:MAG: monofunctional biosynthetic peptidoglycan transglycosylase [Bradyrhizobium sp.]